MTREQAAKYYLAAVKTWNATWDRCTVIDTWSESTPDMERRALATCRKLPALFAKEISSWEHPPAPWPAEVHGPMQDLIASSRGLDYCIRKLKRVTTIDGYYQAMQTCPTRAATTPPTSSAPTSACSRPRPADHADLARSYLAGS